MALFKVLIAAAGSATPGSRACGVCTAPGWVAGLSWGTGRAPDGSERVVPTRSATTARQGYSVVSLAESVAQIERPRESARSSRGRVCPLTSAGRRSAASTPLQRPERSPVVPASVAVQSGARGAIQERYGQGLVASVASQRATVDGEMSTTIPASIASQASSKLDQRDRGMPRVAGSSHAIAVTCAAAPR